MAHLIMLEYKQVMYLLTAWLTGTSTGSPLTRYLKNRPRFLPGRARHRGRSFSAARVTKARKNSPASIVSFLKDGLLGSCKGFHAVFHRYPCVSGPGRNTRRSGRYSYLDRPLAGVPPTLEHPGFSTLVIHLRPLLCTYGCSVSGCLVWMNLVPGQPSLSLRAFSFQSSFLANPLPCYILLLQFEGNEG